MIDNKKNISYYEFDSISNGAVVQIGKKVYTFIDWAKDWTLHEGRSFEQILIVKDDKGKYHGFSLADMQKEKVSVYYHSNY